MLSKQENTAFCAIGYVECKASGPSIPTGPRDLTLIGLHGQPNKGFESLFRPP